MWCVPKVDEEYLRRMEDVLDILAKPVVEQEPVVALDERPVQLLDSARPGRAMAPGRPARKDYEYVRHGTANVFCIVAPKVGGHLTHATRNRKAPRFADALERIAAAYPEAKTIHLVMDNLNTHREKSLTRAFGDLEGHRLWRRFTVHHTPKHGSWLNPAEIEVSLWSRECLGRDRVASFAELSRRTRAWNSRANSGRRRINWQFTIADARRVFGYHRSLTHGAKH
jgi:transposase